MMCGSSRATCPDLHPSPPNGLRETVCGLLLEARRACVAFAALASGSAFLDRRVPMFERRLRDALGRQRRRQEQLDATVLGAPSSGSVLGNGLVFPVASGHQTLGRHAGPLV